MKSAWTGRVFLWMALLLLAACQEPPRPLKVVTNAWPGYQPLYLAQYLRAFRTDIDIVQLPSTTEVMRAFRNGSIDVVAVTLDEALLMMSQGEELVVVMALDFSNGADAVLARPEVDSLPALRGRRIGVENTALGAMMLAAMLDHAGLVTADVDVVGLPIDQHAAAFRAGKVDAVVTFEPVRTQLLDEGARVLFDSSVVPDLVVDVLVARHSTLAARDRQLHDLVQGYYAARSHMVTQPEQSYTYIAQRQGMAPLELQRAYFGLRLPSLNDNLRWMRGEPSAYTRTLETLYALMQQRQLLASDRPLNLPANPRWLQSVPP